MLRTSKLNDNQVHFLEKVNTNNVVKKYIIRYFFRKKIKNRSKISHKEVESLLFQGELDVLILALQKNLIENDALTLFKAPLKGEHNRKKKMELFLLADRLKKENK